MDKKNILLIFLGLVIVFFAYFSYQQNQVISVLNQEIIQLANQRQRTILEKYALQKELDRLKQELHTEMASDSLLEASDSSKNQE